MKILSDIAHHCLLAELTAKHERVATLRIEKGHILIHANSMYNCRVIHAISMYNSTGLCFHAILALKTDFRISDHPGYVPVECVVQEDGSMMELRKEHLKQ